MNFNSLFFPAPPRTYSYLALNGELIYIPKNHLTKESAATLSYIPCLFIPYKSPSKKKRELLPTTNELRNKLLIYFHGNAEDLGHSYEFLHDLSLTFKVTPLGFSNQLNILAVEYPGYGIYRNESASAETIQKNAQIVFDFATTNLRYDSGDILLFGRSMGSGPACHLAALHKPAGLILLSPYTSLKEVVRSLMGSWAAMLVKERFQNLDCIRKVDCHTLIVHG